MHASPVGLLAIAMIASALVAIYLVPTWLALYRRHHAAVFIFWLNLLVGWTLIGWAIAFVWAGTTPEPRQTRTDYSSGPTPTLQSLPSVVDEDDEGLGEYAIWLRRNRGKWPTRHPSHVDESRKTW